MPSRFTHSGRPRSATSLIFQASSGPRLTLSLLSKTIDRPNQSSTPATGSSGLPRNDTRRTYGRTGGSKQKPFLTTVADEAAQARFVAQQILDSREAGTPLKNQAVLFRASHHSAQLEIELTRRNIPFVKYGGLKFLEAAHVKDVLSILR